MQDFSLIPMAVRDTSHLAYDTWVAFVEFAAVWELDRFEAKMAWEFFRGGRVSK